MDAYGCLGVLRINEGKSFNFNFNFDTIAQIFWFSDTNFSLFPSLSFKVPLEQVSDLCDFLGLFCQNCLKLCRLIFFAKLRNIFQYFLSILGDHILHFLVLITGCTSAGKLGTSEVYRVTNVATPSLRGYQPDEEKVAEIRKLLCCGTFYFAWSNDEKHPPIDLTLSAQKSAKFTQTDNRFFWWVLLRSTMFENQQKSLILQHHKGSEFGTFSELCIAKKNLLNYPAENVGL